MLWGKKAQTKENILDGCKIIKTTHPSPNSAHMQNGFIGSGCFIEANEYLRETDRNMISW